MKADDDNGQGFNNNISVGTRDLEQHTKFFMYFQGQIHDPRKIMKS